MFDQLDIISFIDKYPNIPGSKGSGGSQDAAVMMVKTSLAIQEKILRYMQDNIDYTADEIADGINKPVTSVRSRLDELLNKGQVTQTGIKRPNANGINVLTWRLYAEA